jgi:hypothetical protein
MLKLYTMPRLEIYFFTVYCLLFTIKSVRERDAHFEHLLFYEQVL